VSSPSRLDPDSFVVVLAVPVERARDSTKVKILSLRIANREATGEGSELKDGLALGERDFSVVLGDDVLEARGDRGIAQDLVGSATVIGLTGLLEVRTIFFLVRSLLRAVELVPVLEDRSRGGRTGPTHANALGECRVASDGELGCHDSTRISLVEEFFEAGGTFGIPVYGFGQGRQSTKVLNGGPGIIDPRLPIIQVTGQQ